MDKNTEISFEEFCYEYYLPHVKARKRSWRTDRSLICNHLVPFFLSRHIIEIEGKDVMMFQNQKLKEEYQPSSINRMTVLLKFIVNCSMRWGWRKRDRDWAEGASELKNIRSRERFLSPEEAVGLIRQLNEHPDQIVASLIELLLLTGARKSELLFARWEYLDWNFQTLMIPLSKSGSSRHIFLGNGALRRLKEIRDQTGTVFIFSRQGRVEPVKNLNKVWTSVRKAAGLDGIRLHDLRHSYASFLVAQGRSLFEVQKLLGHANSQTTMKYAHLSNRQLLDAADVVSETLAGVD